MKYSFVVPIYNDAYLAEAFCAEFEKVFRSYLNTSAIDGQVELIFVDDGSRNDSLNVLIALTKRFSFLRVIELSRNFGQHIAIACGFREARGALVGRMNVDMQDPPSEIAKLLKVIESEDVDIAIGIYKERKSSLLNRITARIYYTLFNFLTGLKVPQNTSPLRIMNRRFIDAYNGLTESTRFPQGIDEWFGFKKKYVQTEHRERTDGKSSYSFFSRLKLSFEGILAFSDKPLKIALYSGLLASFIALVALVVLAISRLLSDYYVPGYVGTVGLILLTFGIQMTFMGVCGLYIGRILREVQHRPLYVIRRQFDSKGGGNG